MNRNCSTHCLIFYYYNSASWSTLIGKQSPSVEVKHFLAIIAFAACVGWKGSQKIYWSLAEQAVCKGRQVSSPPYLPFPQQAWSLTVNPEDNPQISELVESMLGCILVSTFTYHILKGFESCRRRCHRYFGAQRRNLAEWSSAWLLQVWETDWIVSPVHWHGWHTHLWCCSLKADSVYNQAARAPLAISSWLLWSRWSEGN